MCDKILLVKALRHTHTVRILAPYDTHTRQTNYRPVAQ